MAIFRDYSKKLLCSAVALAMVGSVVTITPPAHAGSRNAIIGFGVGMLIGGILASKHKKSRRAKSRRVIKRRPAKRRVRARTQTRRVVRSRPRTIARAPAPRRINRVNTVSRGDMMQMQSALATLGMYTIAIDGLGGPGTRNAVRIFQAELGYPRTGRMNEEQKTQLFALADRKNNPPVINDSAPVNNGDNTATMPGQDTPTMRPAVPATPTNQTPRITNSPPPMVTPAWQSADIPANDDQDEVSIFSANEVETSTFDAPKQPVVADQPTTKSPKINERDLASVFDSDEDLLLNDDKLVLAE